MKIYLVLILILFCQSSHSQGGITYTESANKTQENIWKTLNPEIPQIEDFIDLGLREFKLTFTKFEYNLPVDSLHIQFKIQDNNETLPYVSIYRTDGTIDSLPTK